MSRSEDFAKLSPAKQKLLLARLRKREEAQERAEGIPPSPLRAAGGPYPLSFAQQRLWFIDRMAPGTAVHNVADALDLTGHLDVAALERTLGALLARHEALRTVFDTVDGKPVQRIVAPPVPPGERVAIPLADLAALPPERAEAEALRLVSLEAALPFDVPRGPHLRVRLVRLGAARHLALLTTHHIVSDGWSMGVLVRELGAFYRAFSGGGPAALPPLPVQYPDFADWQRRTLQGETLEEHLRWWRETLAGAPPVLDLPADHPRPPVQRHRGAGFHGFLPPSVGEAVARLSRERGVTPFMVLLAAFALHLARHAGQEDVVVGSPVANRNRLDTEGLLGFFVNTLVLRLAAGEGPGRTFLDLLDAVRAATLGAYAHQDLPFERLVEALKPERDLSRPPLFQAIFALQNMPLGTLELPGLTLAPLSLPVAVAVVDLTLDAMETPDGLATAWRYDADLFDAATVHRMAARFEVLLAAALGAPGESLEGLPWLAAAEVAAVVCDLTPRPPLPSLSLPPGEGAPPPEDTPALWIGEVCWSYGELSSSARRVAWRLLELDTEPEARVGICLERSPELIVAMLGALAAGLPFVPLDPAYPAERLAWMAADAGLAVLLTSRALAGRVPAAAGTRVLFVEDADGAPERPLPRLDPERLAYVLYTSGSTGRPKGVMVPHRGLGNLAAAFAGLLGVGPESRFLQFASPSFDASVVEVVTALAAGASLRLAPREELLPGPDLARRLAAWGITQSFLSPSALAVTPAEELPGLTAVVAGGEVCPPALAARWGAGRRFINAYGPTEGTVCATAALFSGGAELDGVRLPIGSPLPGVEVVVVDALGRLAPLGVPGELWIGGIGLARGYLGRPDLTAERFIPHPFAAEPGARLYRTGDLVRRRPDGPLDILGRIDRQVKVRGVRIEPGEIEGVLAEHPDVREAAVAVRPHAGGPRLVAWVSLWPEAALADPRSALRAWAAGRLPEALVPAVFAVVPEMPLAPGGKVDRAALPDPEAGPAAAPSALPRAGLESAIARIWCEVLGVERVGREESFFDLGGHSLLLVEVQSRLREHLGREVPILDLFRHSDVAALARHLAGEAEAPLAPLALRERPIRSTSRDVAVIGLACRFPEAPDAAAFWRLLRAGIEAIRTFTVEELAAAGVEAAVLADPAYVRAGGVLDGADLFDAPFFDISPREAQILDPQHRMLLECAAEALERAGHGAGSPALAGKRVGVYAGTGMIAYGLGVAAVPGVDPFEATLGNDKDFIATRLAYELDLRGPALTVQTACSTSLVAVHLACKALLDGECELALAGGVTIQFPQIAGYHFREGGIVSPDGHNRAFDAAARGTVGGNGAGLVLLKPLAAARADGDPILAVIKSTAINNDGTEKIGFTAPSERGQAEVIAAAQELAGVPAETIGYVEAHGSATPLGDPIEVAALQRAFRARAGGAPFPRPVALGSVKTNIGHTGSAAGIAGLIKTILALQHREIPPSLWFAVPNPRIDFAAGPFQVATALTPWETAPGVPRRAGVSSFGLGGTNAHAIVEEAPEAVPGDPGRSHSLLVLSARTPAALESATDRLAAFLREHPEVPLADVAFTLATGRRAWEHRRIVVATDARDAAEALARRDPRRVLSSRADGAPRPVAFVLAGLGEQYAGLARGLDREEPVFREELDRCAGILAMDLRAVLFPGEEEEEGSGGLDLRRLLGRAAVDAGPLDRTEILQPALFAVEYALARLWMSWGIAPESLIGYSLGEYVAACLAGVFSLEEALALVAERARWIAELPAGAMLAVPLPEDELAPWIAGTELDLAATNGPRTSVVSGPAAAVEDLERRLGAGGHPARRLRTTHAFHSRALQPVAPRLEERVRAIGPRPPGIPLLSNVSGTWMSGEQAADPHAWAEHLLRPVRFAEGIARLWSEPGRVLLEIGPGQSLSALALQHPAAAASPDPVALATLPSAHERRPDLEAVLTTLGKLWLAGVAVDWPAVWAREERRRVELPTYPFERQRYWLQGEAALAPAGPPPLEDDGLDLSHEAEILLEAVRSAASEEEALAAIVDKLREGRGRPLPHRGGGTGRGLTHHPRPGLRTAYAEPAGELEAMVAGLWQRLLGIDRVGRHDSFFDLGGDSLLATQALTRVRDAFGVDVPLPDLFAEPTPAGLAALLEKRRGGSASAPRAGIPRQVRDGRPFPTSFAQERLWVIDRIEPGGIAYNLPTALCLSGRLDVGVLARAFAEIVRRHETLRTTFAAGSGGSPDTPPVQIIHPAAPVPLPEIDLAALPEARRDAETRRLAIAEGSTPFDLARGPVLRLRLLRVAADEHALLLTLHHIASDGWSNGVLVAEIAALYDAFAHGRPSPLPELPVQYADYAVWQRATFQGEQMEEALAWWAGRLAGAPVLELPTDRPRPAVQESGGALVALTISEGAGLEALAREEGATLFMAVTAVFLALLSRLAGQEDLTVGLPVANRHHREVEGLIGFFVNTLVLRTDLSGDPPLRELLGRVREGTLAALAHGQVPFSRVVEATRPERSLSHTPLFQVILQLANAPGTTLEAPGLRFSALEAPLDSALFDLNLTLAEVPEGLRAGLEYRTGLFDRTTMQRLLDRYAALLAAAAVTPEARLSALPWLLEAERHQLLEWSRTTPVEDAPLATLFARRVEATPDAPALEDAAGTRLTWRELAGRSLALAHRLRHLGVGPEVPVGLCLDRSAERVVATLAVVLAGGVYVPLDPAWPQERRALLLGEAGTVLAWEDKDVKVAKDNKKDKDDNDIGGGSLLALATLSSSSLACVMFTSGSTGRPKGVAVPRRGVARLARWLGDQGVGPGDTVLQLAPFAFDASTLEIWGALLNGARVVVPPAGALSLEEIGDEIERHGVTVLWLTAGLFHQMAERELPRLASLRLLLAGGDVLSVPHVRRVLDGLPGVRLVNGYGPTENTTFTTCAVLDPAQPLGASVSVGRPIHGTRVVLLDPGLRPVPPGVPGELCTGGAGLARGYLRRPDLTAAAFVPDPVAETPGERLYRTGDRARFLPDGRLEFLGRIDRQVKIRGFRVEPGEIEALLASHPQVGEAVVVVGEDAAGKRLLACVVPAAADLTAADLRAWLGERLPEPMVPAVFSLLGELPLNANGKVDRGALARTVGAGGPRGPGGASTPPRTAAERQLAAIWQELLGVATVGVEDDFFALGGHSLLATRLVSRLREELGREIALRTVFEAPTLGALARAVSPESPVVVGAADPSVPLERVEGEGPFPLSFAQERLWLVDQIAPGGAAYNIPAALRLAGPLRPEVLAAALGEVVRRHATLRTTFDVHAGAPVQVVAPPAPFVLPVVDLSALPAAADEARRLAGAEALCPFDLATGPVLRTRLLRLAPGDHVFLCTQHHIASDGWSMGIFVREVLALVGAAVHGGSVALPELPVRYGDFAVWQRRAFREEVLAASLEYWRRQLAGVEVLELPADRPRTEAPDAAGADEPFSLPAATVAALHALARREGATLFMVLVAAFQAVLARHSGATDIAVGTPVAGRDRTQIEGLIGFFVNTLVLRTDLAGEPTFRELLGRVRDVALAAFAHQELPFARLVGALNPERSLAHAPLFEIQIAFQNTPGTAPEVPGLTVLPFDGGATAAQLDVTLSLFEGADGLRGSLVYRAALFEAATIRRLLDDLATVLTAASADPGHRVADLPLLAPAGHPGRTRRRAPAAEGAAVWEAPRTPTEERLAGLWTQLLGVERAGRQDDFFALGGHSLLATQLVSRVRESFGVKIPLRALFEAPTLAAFAARLDEAAGASWTAPILPVPRTEPLPLSFAQERLWFLDELDPGTPTLNLPFSARLTQPLDDALLARALAEIVRRHEILRTTFGSREGRPFQSVLPAGPVALPVIDLGALAAARRESEAARLEGEEGHRPFDLARGPLLRARVVRLGAADRILLITVHHIVADGWSLSLLRRELGALYTAFASGLPSPLPELTVQYADYAAWQRHRFAGAALASEIAWWRAALDDPARPLPVLDLPVDRPRPPVQTYRGGTVTHVLDRTLSERLASLGRREGATLFMVLLAGLQALLGRLAGQDDVVVGTPVAGRLRSEIEALIGCFLNNLALRTDLGGEPSFRELLGRVRATALGGYEHQDVPFERLLEELRVERDLSRTPLFQVFLNMLNFPAEEGGLGGTDEGLTPEVPSKFDLTIYAAETGAGLRLELVYNSDLFAVERIAGMAEQLEALLAQAVDDPARRIGDLSLLTPGARAVLPDVALPLAAVWQGSVVRALVEGAARRPDQVAVADGRETWTWAELAEGSGRLAGWLCAAGVRTGDVAAVWAHRGAGLPRAVLGALRAGTAVMILDPAYPASRLVEYVQTGRPRAWLGVPGAPAPPPEVLAALEELGCSCRIDLPPGGEDPQGETAWAEVGPDDAAVLTFTSGSTGRPKGVVGRHGPLTAFYPWMGERFALSSEDRFGLLSALSHDPLQRDLFTPVWLGATLCIPDPGRIGAPGYLAEWVRSERISVLHLTPAMLELLTAAAEEAPEGSRAMPSLRRAFVVGDLLKRSEVARLQRLAPALVCVNLYGSTETQRSVGWYEVPRPEEGGARLREALPLGRGMEGVQVLVLTREGRLAGVGELGEIHLRSAQLARGYLGEPALTAERFLPDAGGGRLYRTGDLGRYLPDGDAEFAGRADLQVKIRGFRIEPGEIEAELARFPGVRRCAVVAVEGPGRGERRLVAYVVPETGMELAPAALRLFLGERLPAYMVPADWVTHDALPLTRTGKLDRRALPAPERPPAAAGTAPRNAVERGLAAIWSELLGVEAPGLEDDFFDLGGHSLLATRLLSRVRHLLGAELPLRAVFERPTLAGLAAAVAEAAPALPPVTPRERRKQEDRTDRSDRTDPSDLPLSFGQERLWFLLRLDPGSPAYHLPHNLRLAGPLDAAALAAAFAAVVRRHEILRTRYAAVDGAPVQEIDPPGTFRLPLVDLSALPEEAREEEAAAWVVQGARAPFDLAVEQPLRARLLRLGREDHALSLTLHHIASDGWSNGILVREVAEVYQAAVEGRAAALPELPVQYADFAAWQREAFASGALAAQWAWWRAHLTEAPPPLDLPTDRPRPPVAVSAGSSRSLFWEPDLAAAVEALGRRQGATLFMTLLAGFATLLSRLTGQDDLTVGSPVAGRSRTEIEGLIGFFVNTLVLRVDRTGDPTFAELLGRVRATALGAFVHQDVPFEKLVEELQPERDLAHPPLFQVMLVLQNAPATALEVGGLTFRPIEAEAGAATFDLTLACAGGPQGIGGLLQYKTDLFDAPTIDRWLGHFRTLLAAASAHPDRRLDDLPLLAAAERHQLVVEHNDTAVHRPEDLCLHELFERQVDRTPEAVALVVGETGEEITCRDLDARAGRLAAWLRSRGAGPEAAVGVSLERSPELIVALLAVAKSGAAWVPIDPSYPPERLAFLQQDAACAFVLDRASWPAEPPEAPARLTTGVTPDHLAYRLYTSGSTGTPKAVLVPHRAIVQHMRWLQEEWPLDPGDVMLQAFSASFDASFFDLWAPLLAGARLVLPVAETTGDAARTVAETARCGVTRVCGVPPWIAELAERPELAGATALRQIFLGGQELPLPLARRLTARGFTVASFYGPTEAAVTATAWEAAAGLDGDLRAAPLGRPIHNVRIHLLGAAAEPLPLGVAGELCIAGAGVAQGYAGRPELTADRFRPDPFGEPGARLYRTGDRARRRPDGALEFLGRVDRQVKVRGFRIEPGEVEAVLAGHPDVQSAVVDARRSRGGEARLIAWVVPRTPVAVDALRAWLAERVPEPLLPSGWVLLDALPRTPNGKVDLAALPAPEHLPASGERVPPRDDLERDLAALWEELLDVRPVGIRDDFFTLGGHSLLVLRLLARIERRFGARLAPATLFTAPTVEALAAVLRGGESVPSGPLVVLAAGGDRPPLVWLHAAAGTVTAYLELARRLHEAAPDRPVWALPAPPDLPATLEELAAGHVAALRAAQPEGPYHLAGWSFGGVVAVEMARQLHRAGAAVAPVVLIDTRAPGMIEVPTDLPTLLATFAADQGLPPDVDARDIETLRPLFAAFCSLLGMLRSHRPEPYEGRIELFRASTRTVAAPPDLGWTALAGGGLEIRELPGDHAGVIRGVGAQRLAEVLGGRGHATTSAP